MKEVFKILRQIEVNSSRNTKKDILRQNSDNELLKKYFLYAYDERRVFGIGSKSIKKQVKVASPQSQGLYQNSLFGSATGRTNCGYTNVFDLLDELVKHPFGSNDDVQAVNSFLSKQDSEAFNWYSRLILKDLKIGCTASTINEVWDNYIPTFDVMLAHPYNKHSDKIKGSFQLQRKIDGFRLIVYKHSDGKLQFFTRNGLELFDFPEIEQDFDSIENFSVTMVFDGECISKDNFNDTQKLIMRKDPKINVVYHVFDIVTLSEWESEECDLSNKLFDRYDFLKSIVPEFLEHINVVNELYRGDDLQKITTWFNYAKSQGWEGIMVKMNTPYTRKRTTNMLKVKEFDTLDLRVIRVNEGTGKHAGRLGSVTVDFEGQEVDVGSGFDDYSRERFWGDQNLILDRIIEVQYFERTTNSSGCPSLRFPVFVRIREDK